MKIIMIIKMIIKMIMMLSINLLNLGLIDLMNIVLYKNQGYIVRINIIRINIKVGMLKIIQTNNILVMIQCV